MVLGDINQSKVSPKISITEGQAIAAGCGNDKAISQDEDNGQKLQVHIPAKRTVSGMQETQFLILYAIEHLKRKFYGMH